MVDWGSPKDQLKDHSKCRVCLAALGRLPGTVNGACLYFHSLFQAGVRPPDS